MKLILKATDRETWYILLSNLFMKKLLDGRVSGPPHKKVTLRKGGDCQGHHIKVTLWKGGDTI